MFFTKELLSGLSSGDVKKVPEFKKVRPEGKWLEETIGKLEETVYGQTRACREVARAYLRVKSGLSTPNRPELSAIFAGPTGVGKTSMGEAVARLYYDGLKDQWEKHLKIIDCSNFKSGHEVARLIGSPPGYVGYGDKPLIEPEFLGYRNVIVFDEIEKAHPALHELLLSILDRGELQASVGESTYHSVKNVTLNFAFSTIIMTTNAGSEQLQKAGRGTAKLGFLTNQDTKKNIYEIGLEAVKKHFAYMPELLGRIDSIVIFDHLNNQVLRRIFDKFMDEINSYQTFGVNYIACTAELKDYIISKTNIEYGARDLRKTIEKEILTPAAEVKLNLPPHMPMVADVDEEGICFWVGDMEVKEEPERFKQLPPKPPETYDEGVYRG